VSRPPLLSELRRIISGPTRGPDPLVHRRHQRVEVGGSSLQEAPEVFDCIEVHPVGELAHGPTYPGNPVKRNEYPTSIDRCELAHSPPTATKATWLSTWSLFMLFVI
jgi:septal ring-binding cell division protein DamX